MITLISAIIAVIGALNWFLVGVAEFDLVAYICGGQGTVWARIIYILVGVAGVWLTIGMFRKKGKISKV